MKEIDYLIVGQGIAGSVLSYTFLKAGAKIWVIDPNTPHNSSKAASGVCNPITGRRLVKTWLADDLFPFLHRFYAAMEADLGTQFCFKKEVYRTFDTIAEQNEWFARSSSSAWTKYARKEAEHQIYTKLIDNSFGGWETLGARFIRVDVMMEACRSYLMHNQCYTEGIFNHQDVKLTSEGVSWQDFKAKKIIFCEGAKVLDNPHFNYLPHRPDKGEWLKISLEDDIYLENMIKKQVFIIPLGNREFLVSGTYHKNDLSYQTTEKAKAELSKKLDQVLKLPYQIIDQRAGIRSGTRDRRPYIGLHPQHPQLGIFNGLGTKGLSLSPYFAHHFYRHLTQGDVLHPEADIKRYEKYLTK
ncbi:MAG: FAD-dependent oxidoreductase [Microscillaceae bacterium]|nr:FAD-dependent oxidoreductase [Microscillaceae bacterium]